ncbi:PREDICTED: uncharacterized protein LOC109156989 [Ipomoea nil]|uniref:uncharacterized protein LOC109156989 n=1 Tax=Ipomoea nil TaxID=35883 RepID=UPI00090152C6|nr:PREDICTED: uncharacterized protein LOC109156989 [Ipomoea nil]
MEKISSTLCGFHLAKPPDVEKPHHDNKEADEEKIHKALFDATIKGNWTRAEKILKEHPECATHPITIRNETVVHIAAAGKNKEFVEKLMKILDIVEKRGVHESGRILEQENKLGCSAFYLAVLSGVVKNAEVMVEKNNKLPTIRSKDKSSDDIGKLPINHAALRGRKKMVAYLFQKTPYEMLLEAERTELLQATIRYDMYDTASDIVDKDPQLATKEYDTQRNRTFLHLLARKALAERRWQRFLGSTCARLFPARLWDTIQEKALARKLLKKIWDKYLDECLPEETLAAKIRNTEILHYAAKEGNVEFLLMILISKPDLLWEFNSKGQNIFHIAVLHRQREVFDLIYRFGPFKDLISVQQDNQQNNILHSTAKFGTSKESTGDDNPQQPSVCFKVGNGSETDNKVEKVIPKSLLKVSGAALRLQRELLWFMEVGNVVPPSQHKIRNKENKTPKQIFAEEHRELLKEGEKWMTDTATSCMLVATLIATMVFAAAFTVPGGSNGDTGTPVFIKRSSFTVFMISDAVAMICSIISIIMFLSILISRFRQDDFLASLPLKLLVGLTTLFVSIVGMLVAFAVAFSLIFDKAWQPKLIVAFIVAPFALFLLLNFNLWFDTILALLLVVKIKVGSFKKLYFG